jgi:hypothetical protein
VGRLGARANLAANCDPGAVQQVEFSFGTPGVATRVDVRKVSLELFAPGRLVGTGLLVGDVESFAGRPDAVVEIAAARSRLGRQPRRKREPERHRAADAQGDLLVPRDTTDGGFDPLGGLGWLEKVPVACRAEGCPAEQPECGVVGDPGISGSGGCDAADRRDEWQAGAFER